MTRLAALALVLSATPASAATVDPTPRETAVPFHPGAAPCAGKCPLEWAAAQAGVPIEGKPWAGVIPQGTRILGMSFAGDGPPRWTEVPMHAAIPLAASGYVVTIDGRTYLMAKIRECQNWALIPWGGTINAALRETGLGEIDAPPPATSTPPGTTPGSTPPRVSPPPLPPIVVVVPPLVPPTEPPGVDPEPPAPVSLPAAGLLLGVALGVLAWIGRRRNRT